ncbi:MAG: thioredoxin family protein [Bacteroidales bacterium]|nr:thioredoxin family protein [Bacteroidales bacterium]
MKVFYSLLLVLVTSLNINAQILNPVKWTFSSERVSESEYELIFNAKIDKDWHLYSVYSPENGPLPLFFDFEKNDAYELVGKISESPKPHEVYEDIYKVTVKQFSNFATFKQKVKVNQTKKIIVKGFLDGQSCLDDGMCVPITADFEIVLDPNAPLKSTKAESEKVNEASHKNTSDVNHKGDAQSIEEPSANKEIVEETTQDTAIVSESETPIKEENIIAEMQEENTPTEDNTENSLLWFFIVAFGAGLAAILTPCVFPMIPMTVSFFMKSGDNKAKAKGQALFYAFSIIAIYTIIGTVVAVTLGANFANWLSTHWVPNVFFFLIFVFFAFSFFGMFEITLPSWIVNKSDAQADKGGWSGAFFMAFTLVLVSFSCTGPIVGAILVESASGEILKPIVGMFGFSLAFALPFGIFAFFPALMKNMPKSGGWLNSVKVVLGFLELALGLKFLSIADQTYHWGILDREIYLAIWIVLFTLMGIYLLGKIKFSHDSEVKFISVPRLMFVIITFSFVVYMIPGMFGAPLKMLSGYLPPQESHDFDINAIVRNNIETANLSVSNNKTTCEEPKYADILDLPHGIKGFFDYEQALACAKKQNKPIFIDFTGHGCVNCREMEANVWSDNDVLKKLKNDFVVVALYVDDKTELPENEWYISTYDGREKKTIGKKYADFQISKFNVNAQPYYVILDHEGNQLTNKAHAYDKNIEAFKSFLNEGLKNFKNK